MDQPSTAPEIAIEPAAGDGSYPGWEQAEYDLWVAHAHIEQAAEEQAEAFRRAMQTRLLTPLRIHFGRAARTHRRLMQEAALHSNGRRATPTAREAWERLRAYRSAVAEQVVVPIFRQLSYRARGDVVGPLLLDLLERLEGLSVDLPPELALPETDALYTPALGDRWRTAHRKAAVLRRRARRAWYLRQANRLRRLVRAAPHPTPAYSRTVPFQTLLDYHLRVRLPESLFPLCEAAQQALARRLAALEDTLTTWTLGMLRTEEVLDRPAFHAPSDLPWDRVDPAAATDPVETAPAADLETWHRLAGALQATLDEAAADTHLLPDLDAGLHAAAGGFARDLHRGGTFLLDLRQRSLPAPDQRPIARIKERFRHWSAWHRQVMGRLELIPALIGLRDDLLKTGDRLLNHTASVTLAPIFQTFQTLTDELDAARRKAEQACELARQNNNPTALIGFLRTLYERTPSRLEQTLSELPGLVSSGQVFNEPGRLEWEQLQRYLDALPRNRLLHPPRTDPEAPVIPDRRPQGIDLHEVAEDALMVPFPERLHKSAQLLQNQIGLTWSETEQVQSIVTYNLGAALEELESPPPSDPAPPAEEPDEAAQLANPIDAARELATDGLRRASDKLAELIHALHPAWNGFSTAVFRAIEQDWRVLYNRVETDEYMRVQWIGLQARLVRRVQQTGRTLRRTGRRYADMASQYVRTGRRQTERLIRRGQEAVGVLETSEDQWRRTLDTLVHVHVLHQRLPLVYRKLFSFEPVQEPSLLEGRKRDLLYVRTHYRRWKDGLAGALVLAMPPGSGRTSVMNVVETILKREADVRSILLTERSDTPDAFAEQVAAMLNLDLDGPATLDALEALLPDLPGRPQVCLIENFEHLLLRVSDGTRLLERVLIFLSRTDTQICWIVNMTSYAWRFIQRTVRSASGFVNTYVLSPFDRDTFETIILNRHRRSGMPLWFLEPPSQVTSYLPNRLRKKEEDRQKTLRIAFFDRLYRVSGQTLLLALFYWIRSVEFQVDENRLVVHPLQPIDFSFLGTFDMNRAFTLGALLMHTTLTLEEHNRIFRMTDAESTFVLESLLNLRLILPYRPGADRDRTGTDLRVRPGTRYRLHPLIIHPVTELLRQRHIVY